MNYAEYIQEHEDWLKNYTTWKERVTTATRGSLVEVRQVDCYDIRPQLTHRGISFYIYLAFNKTITTYVIPPDETALFTTDEHGNPKDRSCFFMPIGELT